MKKMILVLLAGTAIAASASAQQVSTYTFERKVASDEPQHVILDKLVAEQGLRVTVEKRTVTNAPYSADAINESVQVLPDGNRIVHRTTTRVYRDSAGRTRREALDDSGQVTLITINDPAAGTAYVFDPRTGTTSQSMMKMRSSAGSDGATWTTEQGTATAHVVVTSADKAAAEAAVVAAAKERVAGQPVEVRQRVAAPAGVVGGVSGGTAFYYVNGAPATGETTKEDLGQQTIDGVTATGTRTTTVIPAGAIGNEQPIKIVSEEWTSPDLQVLVMTKHNDPRTGETTYRLSSVTRTEPAKALFEAPEKK